MQPPLTGTTGPPLTAPLRPRAGATLALACVRQSGRQQPEPGPREQMLMPVPCTAALPQRFDKELLSPSCCTVQTSAQAVASSNLFYVGRTFVYKLEIFKKLVETDERN